MESNFDTTNVSQFGEKPRRKRTLDDKACEVCEDKSTGKHYGVYCCDGCSGFFKRTVRRSTPWVCRNNNQCVVDRGNRTDCRACRFKKCLMVNMKPEGVQNSHGSRVSQENTDSIMTDGGEPGYLCNDSSDHASGNAGMTTRDNLTDNAVTSFSATNNSSPPISMALADGSSPDFQNRSVSPVFIKVETKRSDTYNHIENNSEIIASTSETVGNHLATTSNSPERRDVVSQLDIAATKSSLVTISKPVRPVMSFTQRANQELQLVPSVVSNDSFTHSYPYQPTQYPSTSSVVPPYRSLSHYESHTPTSNEISLRLNSESLQKMAVHLVSNSVNFAKNISSFKTMPFRDQIILLEESWKDLFIIDAAFFSIPLDMSYIAPPGEGSSTLISSLRVLQDLVTRIQALALDKTECQYLKTVVLFKPDIKGLKDSEQVERHQDEAQVKLLNYTRTTHAENPARFGRMLLTLSAFERVSQDSVEKLFFRAENDKVEFIIHDLFKKT
ncbi:photoreceptor-specific nuclear receptor-like [Dendronephthya gigantea]|uniref:photoreceptor-specific nuclear receptor-like n=1 Tax=Dendronephthya gigantea TaxID=151771 RepID=UPI00106D6119|nr:photoreceptor-specific nuclear receptor-like [Dendronephthya gigantea]XP_028396334.1 photoreceptor-specific nuclear receptor-like [Dendronephthya gigantea]